LRAKPADGGGTMTCADTGCVWVKQLKRFMATLAFVLAETKFQFCFSFISIVLSVL